MNTPHRHGDPPDWEGLARDRAGEGASGDAAAVRAWLARHPGEARRLDALDGAVRSVLPEPPAAAVDVEGALARVHGRLAAEAGAAPVLRLSRVVPPAGLPWGRARWILSGAAAAAAAIALLAIGLSTRRGARAATDAPVLAATAAPAEFHTKVGTLDTVRFADGSLAVLAPASRLVIGRDYGRGARDVVLEGVALFAVRHDAGAPFTVHAGPLVIRDAGTRFVVRAPVAAPDGGAARSVAVLEGAVDVRAVDDGAVPFALRAGERAMLDSAGRLLGRVGAAGDADAAWTRGDLRYQGAPLAVVRDDLARWYGVELRLGDPALASRRLTASFAGQSIADVLRTIALATGTTVERAGAVATLRVSAIGR